MLLNARLQLKNSFERGELSIYHPQQKKTYRTNALDGRTMIDMTNEMRRIGYGATGLIHVLRNKKHKPVCVMKASPYHTEYIGDPECPFQPENTEPRIARVLWNYCSSMTPHLIMPLGCVPNTVGKPVFPQKSSNEYYKNSKTTSLYFQEYCNMLDVHTYLKKTACHLRGAAFDRIVRIVLLQQIYTLSCIQVVFPRFRHNECKTNNILLEKLDAPVTTMYHFPNGMRMMVETDLCTRLSDFDFSIISGVQENTKVFETFFSQPALGMHWKQNSDLDLAVLVGHFFRYFDDRMTPEFRQQLNVLYRNTLVMLQKRNYYRFHALIRQSIPSMEEVLRSSLFDEFVIPSDQNPAFDCAFHASVTQPVPVMWLPWFDQWKRSLVMDRHLQGLSVHYYAALPLDEHNALTLDDVPDRTPISASHMLLCLKSIYKHVFEFDMTYWDAIKRETITRAHQTMECAPHMLAHRVLHPLLYVIAFMDCVNDHPRIVRAGKILWHMEDWIDFLNAQIEDDALYSPQHLLEMTMQYSWYHAQ